MARNGLSLTTASGVILLAWLLVPMPLLAKDREIEQLRQRFTDDTGANLVFIRDGLPDGRYHDVLKPLDQVRRKKAALICIDEAKYYPQGYFGRVGLKTIGVFDACVSKTTTDPSRPFDQQLGGYRYFGVYNKHDAIAAAFYSEGQLALTFHHEIFHHVDSTVLGQTAAWHLSGDDAFYQAAVSGRRPYTAPPIRPIDLQLLRQKCIGFTLKDSVSAYAAKNLREDQAETARHLMSMLPNSLVQAIQQPHLAGSQRILHVLGEYEKSVPDGPDFDWFVDVAIGRETFPVADLAIDDLVSQLQGFADGNVHLSDTNAADIRRLLKAAVRFSPGGVSSQQANQLILMAAVLTEKLMRDRIQPDQSDQTFSIWGREDADGANHTLRHDLITFGRDSKRLAWILANLQPSESTVHTEPTTRAILANLRLLARYRSFIAKDFSLSSGTSDVMDKSRSMMLQALTPSRTKSRWRTASWTETAAMPD
jgi:hypothetical protein